jgi:hypothetical protein
MNEQYESFCPCCGSAEHRAMSRRTFMNLIAGTAAGLMMPPAFADAQPVPAIPYDSIANPVHLPKDIYFGECSGVALNSHGHIFVLSRGNTNGPAYGAAAAQLLEFAADGRFVREIGHNLYAWSFAHMVKVDRQDNIWVTDKGSDMVIKFTPDGRVAMVFGRKQEAADEDTAPLKHPNPPLPAEPGRFRQVTDVAWDVAGNTYISDGYINSRVAKVDRDGNWIKSWGDRGTGPGQFHTPHSTRSMRTTTSMSPTVATGAFRCSTPKGISSGNSRSTYRCRRMRVRRSTTCRMKRQSRQAHLRQAHLGPSASRPDQTRCSIAQTLFQAVSTR